MSYKAIDTALDFLPHQTSERKNPLAPIAKFFAAMFQGIEMANLYQTLTERGFAPDVAARKALKTIGASR